MCCCLLWPGHPYKRDCLISVCLSRLNKGYVNIKRATNGPDQRHAPQKKLALLFGRGTTQAKERKSSVLQKEHRNRATKGSKFEEVVTAHTGIVRLCSSWTQTKKEWREFLSVSSCIIPLGEQQSWALNINTCWFLIWIDWSNCKQRKTSP